MDIDIHCCISNYQIFCKKCIYSFIHQKFKMHKSDKAVHPKQAKLLKLPYSNPMTMNSARKHSSCIATIELPCKHFFLLSFLS